MKHWTKTTSIHYLGEILSAVEAVVVVSMSPPGE